MKVAKYRLGLIGLSALAMTVAGCGSDGTASGGDAGETAAATDSPGGTSTEGEADAESPAQAEVREVVSGLPFPMGVNTSPTAVAEYMGYFEEEGLEVTTINAGSGAEVVQGVLAGQIDIGYALPDTVMQTRQQEAGEPVMTYNYLRSATSSVFAVLADSPLESLEDFAGHTIGVNGLESGPHQMARGILSLAGVAEDEVDYLAVGTGGQAIQALTSGDVDALMLWDTEYANMELEGLELRYLTDPGAEPLVSSSYYFTSDFIDESPDVVTKFGRAMAKASLFTATNPEAALRILYEQYPETRVAGTPVEEQVEQDLVGLEARLGSLVAGDPAAGESWGEYPDGAIEAYVDFALQAGIIDDPIEPSVLYTNEFVPGYNDFDQGEVVESAETWEPAS